MKQEKAKLAIIGSGATAIYLLKHLCDAHDFVQTSVESITIFEKSDTLGMGMPYNPATTDIYNMSNISSEEIPELMESFADWLRLQDDETLRALNIFERPIKDSEVYSRIALGKYLHSQYCTLIAKLRESNLTVVELPRTEIIDIKPKGENLAIIATGSGKETLLFNKVVIATGHYWNEDDKPNKGYYASPWPIHKLLPKENSLFNFTVGTLGASLSAFDVVSSLAHRHGKFVQYKDGLRFDKYENAQDFKLVMHSAEGWLPHLQYEQRNAMREIYRHTDREQIMSIVDEMGFLSLKTYFDTICRAALIEAFTKDNISSIVEQLKNPMIGFEEFVDMMSERHEYFDSFEGMRKELVGAKISVEQNRPIHWKETLDDLMYCLNFHAELLPAEDYLFLKKKVMPFLMNVIAALPLSSAHILLALEEAGCIDMVAGKVTVMDEDGNGNKTVIEIEENDGNFKKYEYDLFINCAGQKDIGLENYPFKSLIENNMVRKARAKFNSVIAIDQLDNGHSEREIFVSGSDTFLYTGGIDIDAAYRIIDKDGNANEKIHDITFTHTAGCRPYSYGLQACNATSKILVESWQEHTKGNLRGDIEKVSQLYKENADL